MDSTASSLPKIKNNVIIHEKDDMNRGNMLNFPLQNIENSGSDLFFFLFINRHVFVKHGCPRRQQSQNMAKISKSYILTPPHPQGQVMSVKCEEPIDELTVQVWLLYDHPNFKYCTLFESGTELRTDGQTDGQTNGQTDGRTIRLLDAPGGPFRL